MQLRNIHIPAGVSRLTGQEGVVERNDQPTVKRKKRASRRGALDVRRSVLHVNMLHV